MIKILNVVGARPNLMKIAPLVEAMSASIDIEQTLLHTGQHYDDKMSQIFFDQLGIPKPDIYLGIGSGSHAEQTAKVMVAFEQVLLEQKPNVVVVVGDVNSTLACSITAAKLSVPVAHVEAGLRSFDRNMPEEINRIVTDALSSFLFITSQNAQHNLLREGVTEDKIFFVGNVMIDTLSKHRTHAKKLNTLQQLDVTPQHYALLTLHRPSNVDNPEVFAGILKALHHIQQKIPILFPAHPRTSKRIKEFGFQEQFEAMSNVRIVEPLGYLEFLNLMMHAKLVLTDSGGIQEETTILGTPCLTLRENTERPVTITDGTNILVGTNPANIIKTATDVLQNPQNLSEKTPPLWDGQTAKRIIRILQQQLS